MAEQNADQRRWIVVSNQRAGSGQGQPALDQLLAKSNTKAELRVVRSPRALTRTMNKAAHDALERGAILVAHGGDGTVNLAARLALELQIPLGVLPGGTYNYFARELGMPVALEGAVQALASSGIETVHLASVNGHPFVLNLSLGLHSRLLRERERDMRELGRSRWVVAWSTLKGLLRPQPRLRLQLHGPHDSQKLEAAALTVIRSPLQRQELGLDTDHQSLTLMSSAAQSRWELLRAALHLRLGKAHAEPTLAVHQANGFELHALRGRHNRRLQVAVDGEQRRLRLPLKIALDEHPLAVARPAETTPIP